MNILLGITGSVASVLTEKMVLALSELGDVKIVATEKAKPFLRKSAVRGEDRPYFWIGDKYFPFYDDHAEWVWPRKQHPMAGGVDFDDHWRLDDEVLHIELRRWADMMVIAPLGANTMAKIANGLCDNLLTSVVRAWDWNKPFVVAPAMNTFMWNSPFTEQHLNVLRELGARVVPPIAKKLACGDDGVGAMALIDDIAWQVAESSCNGWQFPIKNCTGIPVESHPGAFGVCRKHSHHTGVDLYTVEGEEVHAMEGGVIISREHFTGPQDTSPWWNNTDAIVVEGASGVVCYGEIEVYPKYVPGYRVKRGEIIGRVIPVLPEGKERPDIPGHSRSMLHIELYTPIRRVCSNTWALDQPKHNYLLDPTPRLLLAKGELNELRM